MWMGVMGREPAAAATSLPPCCRGAPGPRDPRGSWGGAVPEARNWPHPTPSALTQQTAGTREARRGQGVDGRTLAHREEAGVQNTQIYPFHEDRQPPGCRTRLFRTKTSHSCGPFRPAGSLCEGGLLEWQHDVRVGPGPRTLGRYLCSGHLSTRHGGLCSASARPSPESSFGPSCQPHLLRPLLQPPRSLPGEQALPGLVALHFPPYFSPVLSEAALLRRPVC